MEYTFLGAMKPSIKKSQKSQHSAPAPSTKPLACSLELPLNYATVLAELKARVRAVHTQAVVTVNRALIALYLDIGRRLVDEAATAGWGDRVVEHVAADLQAAFPDVRGFSRSNVFYMRQVALAWAGVDASVQQLDNCPGGTIYYSSPRSATLWCAPGISRRPSPMGGVGQFSRHTLRRACMRGKGKR
ncbi:MAG TPA: DUF1016 N-terminal domain-containing protein [Gemmatimonadaceae bacterium]|nr:DUF1016 N-terminal domain-containing protein [Gemmatimonadaceae bacterium]